MCYDNNAQQANSRPPMPMMADGPRPVTPNGYSTVERLAQENDRLQAQIAALVHQNQAMVQQVQKANQEARTATEFAKMLCNQQGVNPIPW